MVFHTKRRMRKALLYLLLGGLSLLLVLTTDFSRFMRSPYEDDEGYIPVTQEPERFSYRLNREVIADKGEVINHVFSYPINIPDACTQDTVYIVFPVHSAITNPRRRVMTRKSKQGLFTKVKENKALLLFFVGLPSKNLTNSLEYQYMLQNESALYGDIIQVNVSDTYHNLAYKAIAVLQWVSMYCAKSDFVIKMDDDVNVDPPPLLWSLYNRKKDLANFIMGELRLHRKPERSEEKKWHIKESEWPNTTFPPFVPGPAVGYPTSTVLLLHKQAKSTRVIWLDDIFITGICSQKLGIPVLNDTNFHDVHRPMRAPHFVYDEG